MELPKKYRYAHVNESPILEVRKQIKEIQELLERANQIEWRWYMFVYTVNGTYDTIADRMELIKTQIDKAQKNPETSPEDMAEMQAIYTKSIGCFNEICALVCEKAYDLNHKIKFNKLGRVVVTIPELAMPE